ncbi:hypothetical protein BJV77DRAFT_950787, partial [Russula vinacea]
DLQQKVGFQRDSMRNMALLTLHADYIGGLHANYHKWYFAAQLDLDDASVILKSRSQRLRSKRGSGCNHSEKSLTSALERWSGNEHVPIDRVRQ